MCEDNKKSIPEPLATPGSDNASRMPILNSSELFAGRHEVWIRHHSEVYRLQRTKADKLILTK